MRERNVEIARAAIEAFNRGEVETLLGMSAEDIEIYGSDEMVNSGRFRGHEGYQRWTTAWLEAWDEFHVVVLGSEALDDRHVILDVRQVGRGALSGVDTEMDATHLFEIDAQGKIVRFELHPTRAAALAEVG
jgi:hypothetical protein